SRSPPHILCPNRPKAERLVNGGSAIPYRLRKASCPSAREFGHTNFRLSREVGMPVPYRLGLDIGTNSIGWCVFDLDRNGRPKSIRKIGVRIFSDGRDPQSGTSLAAERRGPRGARRRRDRYLRRRADLMKALIGAGLMPADETARKALERHDPYRLRAEGLDRALSLHEFGRALFHLN